MVRLNASDPGSSNASFDVEEAQALVSENKKSGGFLGFVQSKIAGLSVPQKILLLALPTLCVGVAFHKGSSGKFQ
jgi:hypothetical protein